MARRIFRLLSAGILFGGLTAAALLCRGLIERERQESRQDSEAEAQRVAALLRAGVLQSLDGLPRLAQWWLSQGKPLDWEDWRGDGQLFLARSPGLRQAIWIAKDGLQHWSAATGTRPNTRITRLSEPLQGLYLSGRHSQGPVLSAMFGAADGRSAFYALFPVAGAKDACIVGLFDAATLVSSFRTRGLPTDLKITVRSSGKTLYSSGAAPAASVPEATAWFPIGSQNWAVSTQIPQQHLSWLTGRIFAMLCVIGSLLYASSVLLYFSQSRSSAFERANREMQRLNTALNRKIADFQALVDVIPIGIAIAHDPACRVITVNRALAAITGVAEDANISKSGPDAASLPYRVARDARELRPDELPMQVAAATGKPVLAEEDQILRADGRVVDVLSFASPVFDESGAVRGVLNACVDISERNAQERARAELEKRLQRDERMTSLGVMAAGIAHDFNNLLTSIIGQASLAMQSVTPASPMERQLAELLESSNRAADLIRRVMSYTGNARNFLVPTDIADIARSWCTQDPRIRVNLQRGLPLAVADAEEIRRAIQHLVSNALEASDKTSIEIQVDCCDLTGNESDITSPGQALVPGPYLRVAVSDDGGGMAPEIADRAFDPFFSTKFLGRGLGLSEVLGIIRSHNGAVRLRSSPDRGTRVEMFIPVCNRKERAA